jgi:methionyl-tRNA formyltransferase
MLVDTIRNLEHRKANAIVQDTSQVTKAPKIKPEMRQIDFVGMEAADIEALFRAIGQQSPLMTSFWLLPDKSKQAITSKKVNLQLHHIFIPEKSVLRNSPNNMVPGL